MAVVIKYDGKELTPTPFLSRSMEPVDAGGLRLGFVQNYDLNGFLSINGLDYGTALNKFTKSPAVLKINNEDIKVFVSSFAISDTAFDIQGDSTSETFVPYSVKFKSYVDLPDKIKRPTLEYSYSEEANRVISLSIKASAQGITSVEDARVFVDALVEDFRPNTQGGQSVALTTSSATSAAVPIRVAHATNWALISTKRSIDRTTFTYSVERNFKRNPGGISDTNFKFFETVDVSQSLSPVSQELKSYDFNVNLKILCEQDGLNVKNVAQKWTDIESSIQNSNSYVKKIVDHYLLQHNITVQSPDNIEKLSFSKNESANEMTLKFTLVDCHADDFKGYFSYSVSTDYDLALDEKSVSIDGEFVSKGDISNRREWLHKWTKGVYTPNALLGANQNVTQKNNGPDFFKFVHLLKGISPIDVSLVTVDKVDVDHNANKASLKLSSSLDDKQRLSKNEQMSFNVDAKVGIPVYKFSASANIEGHFIIQDFQCKSLETFTVDVNGKTSDSLPASTTALMALGKDVISSVYTAHKQGDSWVHSVPESISVNESKVENSFDMSFSAIVKGVDYGLKSLIRTNPEMSNLGSASTHGKRFGK